MPPKTLTAEQVAEIDRQQRPAFNPRNLIPQAEDVLTAGLNATAARENAPQTLSVEQVDAAEAQNSVSAMTPFGRAMGAKPDMAAGPVVQPKKRLSAQEVDQIRYDQISSPDYLPTKDEWKWFTNYKQQRDNKVSQFAQGAWNMGEGLVRAAGAIAYAPFDFLVRGTKAYDEWVNSAAEGVRQSNISLAEIWSWAGDTYEDNQRELQRYRNLNNEVRKKLAAENKFTGNPQQDEKILEQAIAEAKAAGLYEKNPRDLQEDEDTQYERFIRNRSFQQQAANVTETNIGGLPDGQREMGIDPAKVNPGLATTTQLIVDPLNVVVPAGLGALGRLRLLRRAASLTGTPLKGSARVAGAGARKIDEGYGAIIDRIQGATGLNEAQQLSALNNPVTWRAVAAMAALKTSGKVLRNAENWLETGGTIAKEVGTGGVGVARADAAARLRGAAIPERYRRAYDGFFTSADSTLRRISETPGLSPVARRTSATLDRLGATQAFRLADDAVSGAVATAPFAVPLAAIAPEDQRPEILGALMTVGGVAGVVGGKVRRMSEMEDALVAKMLADAEVSGGDAASLANMLPHDKLARMAQMQSVISSKADFIPLRSLEYERHKTVQESLGNGTKGFYVEAGKGQRPRIFVNIDKLASGDVAGHEIGHAILQSDMLGGRIKRSMRAMVDAQYGTDGVAARGREYVKSMLTQEVNQGATGIDLTVLRPDEVTRLAAVAGDKAAEKALKDELIRERWANDAEWRQQQINDRADLLNQERLARGEMEWDWARDEISAETFSGLGPGLNLSGVRASGPLGRALGAAQTAFETMGARFRGNGRLESPNKLFTENPLFDTPQMRKAVNQYIKTYDRYLAGLEKEGKVKQRGTPIAPTGKASDAARSPHTRVYQNGATVESDLFIQQPDGTLVPKSQQMINTQDKARAATLKSINTRDRFVPEGSSEWGARRLSNGRVEVGGPTLPLQFDHFIQVPEWLRAKAREFEAGRSEGRSYLYSYNAIGTGESGSYKIKNLGNVEAKTGEAVPFGWTLSTKNHLLAKVIDLNSFRAAAMRAIDNQQLGEFGNDLRQVEAGLKQLLKNHNDGVPGETGLGVTKKNILNGLLGTGTPTQRASNPAWYTLNNQGSIRTFRFDRLNYADPYDTGYFPHYEKININALPDGAGRMSVDDWMRFDADRQAAWLNNRARERGYTNSTNWANSDEAGFAAASDEYRKLFPRPDNNNRMPSALPQAGMAMPDTPANLTTDQILRELEENQGYLGLSTLGMREGRPVKGGAQQTRELLKRNTALNEELRRRGVQLEDAQLQRALAKRGQAMPDVAVVPERFTGTGQEPNRRSRFVEPPPFFARFPIESYERGGKFFDAQSGEDLTGRSYGAGFIDVSSGKPRLFVDGDPAAQPAKSGRTYRTNLFKQKAGWKWISDNAPATSTIVSVEGGGRHVYALRADFEGGVDLARYSDKPSEPRLRPTARGELSLGNEVGRISIRGKEHPVYDGARISQQSAPRGQAMPDTGDYTNDRLRKLSDDYNGNDPNMTDQDVVEQMRFIIEDAPAGYFPKSLSDNIDKALRDIDEQYREWGGRDDLRSVERAVEQTMRFIEKPRKATGGTRGQAMPDVGSFDESVGGFVVDAGDDVSLPVHQQAVRGKPALDATGKPKYIQLGYDLLDAPGIKEYAGLGPEDTTKPDYKALAYDTTLKGQKQINDAIDSGAVDNAANRIVSLTQEAMKNPEIAAGMGWYSRMRKYLLDALGEEGRELLSQLLGATSAKTPVEQNFLQAMDALEGIRAGRYEGNRKSYLEMLAAEEGNNLTALIVERGYVSQVRKMADDLSKLSRSLKGEKKKTALAEASKLRTLAKTPASKWTKKDRFSIMINATGMVPLRSNGKKFNANSMAVLKVIAGTWLDNRNSPKTPNFAGNLSGRTVQATIDVWAARLLRETLYEGSNKPWRIQPRSETGVNNQDFALGQIIMQRAAKKLDMNPDDLQAVLWFAEKHRWDERGWTKNQGAEKSSFDEVFKVFFPKGKKPLTFAEASKIFEEKE